MINPYLALKGKNVVSASCGRHHTVVVTEDGESYSFGLNKVRRAPGWFGIGLPGLGFGFGLKYIINKWVACQSHFD
jgi:hypothetical protein